MRKLQSIDHHRNGVSGEPFSIVKFSDGKNGNMIAIVFDTPMHTAVFNFDKLKEGETRFFYNSWRGDDFDKWLRTEITAEELAKYKNETGGTEA